MATGPLPAAVGADHVTVAAVVDVITTATAVGTAGASITTTTPAAGVDATALVADTTNVYVPPAVKPDTEHVNVEGDTALQGVRNDSPAAVPEPAAVTV